MRQQISHWKVFAVENINIFIVQMWKEENLVLENTQAAKSVSKKSINKIKFFECEIFTKK